MVKPPKSRDERLEKKINIHSNYCPILLCAELAKEEKNANKTIFIILQENSFFSLSLFPPTKFAAHFFLEFLCFFLVSCKWGYVYEIHGRFVPAICCGIVYSRQVCPLLNREVSFIISDHRKKKTPTVERKDRDRNKN